MKKSLLLPVLLLLSSCASITGSKNQPISVNTVYDGDTVENAKCTLMNDKGTWYVTTPGSLMVQKSYGDMAITCKKKGLKPGILNVASASNGGVWGNIVAGGLIGYAVDASSGAGFDYPTNLNVEMGKIVTIEPKQPDNSQKPTTNN